ncbi:alginate lyase family protein [Cetobacterium sp.]|uniref:alginate lyase family protein n=1 Tax=Cetobacterium sp. TaxID=2071632 RepID=UPI003EE69078
MTEVLSLSYFYTGDYEFAKQTLKKAQYKRLASNIGSKGQNFHELERTRPLHYSIFDLEALISLALYSDRFEEIGFWEFIANKASLKKVVDFIVKYKQNSEEWIKKNEKVDYRSFAGILLIALQKYNDKSYITVIDELWKLDSENINYLKWNRNI